MKIYQVKFLAFSSLLVLSTSSVFADEVSDLKSQVNVLLERLNKLEKKQSDQTHKIDQQNQKLHKLNFENTKKIETLKTENQQIAGQFQDFKKNTATAGPEEGTFYIPGTRTALGIYGFVKAELISENKPIGGDSTDPNYQSSAGDIILDGSNTGVRGPQRAFTARESRIGFKVITPTDIGTITALIEADFMGGGGPGGGSSYYPRLRKAYGSWKAGPHELTVGQTDSVFGDDEGGPGDATIFDGGGIVGGAGGRVPMIRYGYQISPEWRVLVSLEEPQVLGQTNSLGVNSGDDINTKAGAPLVSAFGVSTNGSNVLNRIPAFAAQLRYERDNYHVALRGIVQQIHLMGAASEGYKKTTDKYTQPAYDLRKFAGAFGLSGHYRFNESNTLMLEANYGSGMSSFNVGSSGVALDLTETALGSTDVIVQAYAQRSLGLCAAFEHKWSEKWKSTLGVGYERIYNQGFMKDRTVNRYMQTHHVNLVYEPVKNLTMGPEYSYQIRRVEKPQKLSDGTSLTSILGHVHRFQLTAKYKF